MIKTINNFINEKLKINKDNKVIKSINQLQKGDKIYLWDTDREENYYIYVGVVEEYEEEKFKGKYLPAISYTYKYKGKEYDNGRVVFYSGEDVSLQCVWNAGYRRCISTDYDLLKKVIDDKIDESIKPLQEKIDKIQEQINNKLAIKTKSYLDYEENK